MAGIDVLNQFPRSKMAAAVDLGQSRFVSGELTTVASSPALKSGQATMAAVNGTTSTATLLTLCGLTTSFSTVMFTVVTSAAGVAFTPPTPAVVYPQGSTVTFNNVSTSANQVTVLTALADVVTVNYVGT